VTALTFRERPAAGNPAGLLVLHHGRGADEHDLLPFGDVLDPQRRLRSAHVGLAMEWLGRTLALDPAPE
jgi:predicted esterase